MSVERVGHASYAQIAQRAALRSQATATQSAMKVASAQATITSGSSFDTSGAQFAQSMDQAAGAGGTVSGLAQWLRLTFADDIIYENRPGSADNLHWRISLAPTDPRETMPGARYCAGGTYAADTLVTWCAPNVALASD